MRVKFNRMPSDRDLEWDRHVEDSISHLQKKNFGMYRNTRLCMAELLDSEEESSIELWLEVVSLDLNGVTLDTPIQTHYEGADELEDCKYEFKPFDLENGFTFVTEERFRKIAREFEKLPAGIEDGLVVFNKVFAQIPASRLMPLSSAETCKRLLDGIADWERKGRKAPKPPSKLSPIKSKNAVYEITRNESSEDEIQK